MAKDKIPKRPITGQLITDSIEKARLNKPVPPKKDNINNKED